MRNFIIGFIAAVIMFAANAKLTPAPENLYAKNAHYEAPRIYTRYGTVYGLEFNEGAVIVQTDDGELWEFYNGPTTEDWMLDDGCLLTFIDAGVPGWMYDDEIVYARYWWNEEVH